jgi:hypothetical protein
MLQIRKVYKNGYVALDASKNETSFKSLLWSFNYHTFLRMKDFGWHKHGGEEERQNSVGEFAYPERGFVARDLSTHQLGLFGGCPRKRWT